MIDYSGKKLMIGIDPGFNNSLGICIYNPRTNEMKLFGGEWYDGIEWMGKNANLAECVVVLENPALESATYKGLRMVKGIIMQFGSYMKEVGKMTWPLPKQVEWSDIASELSKAFVTSQRVGENKAAGKLMKKLLERCKVDFIEISPSDRDRADKKKSLPIGMMTMPLKANAFQFKTLTGYPKRSNGHARDAATLVWGKNFQWFALMKEVGTKDRAKVTRQKSVERRKAETKIQEIPKEKRQFFNVVGSNGTQKVTKDANGRFVFVDT